MLIQGSKEALLSFASQVYMRWNENYVQRAKSENKQNNEETEFLKKTDLKNRITSNKVIQINRVQ